MLFPTTSGAVAICGVQKSWCWKVACRETETTGPRAVKSFERKKSILQHVPTWNQSKWASYKHSCTVKGTAWINDGLVPFACTSVTKCLRNCHDACGSFYVRGGLPHSAQAGWVYQRQGSKPHSFFVSPSHGVVHSLSSAGRHGCFAQGPESTSNLRKEECGKKIQRRDNHEIQTHQIKRMKTYQTFSTCQVLQLWRTWSFCWRS